jgi:hypothetical protein
MTQPVVTTKKNRLATIPTTGQPPAKPLDVDSPPNLDMSESVHSTKPLKPGELIGKPEDWVGTETAQAETKEAGNIGEVRRQVEKMSHDEESAGSEALAGGDSKLEGEDWEKIDRSEATEDKSAGGTAGDLEGLKRKLLDRSESSAVVDGDFLG